MIISWTRSSDGWARSIRRLAGAAAGAAAFAATSAPAAAQDPNLVDQGRYDIRIGDRASGTEAFAIRRQGEGYMAVGRIQLEGTGAWLRSAEFALLTDGGMTPTRYEAKGIGNARSSIAIRTGTRIRITNSGEEGDRMTELLANPSQVLLSPGIAQHYYFLARRLSAGGGSLTALIPSESREVPIRVLEREDESVEVGGESVPAIRWRLSIGDATHIVWAGREDGRILRVEIPERDWRSVRRAE